MFLNSVCALKAEYVAGFFDGEGSIGIYRNGRGTWHLRTQLTQNSNPTVEKLLSELRSTFGGHLAVMQSPIYRRNKAFNWQLNGIKAREFLCFLLPHLVLKKEQAQLAISWQEHHPLPTRDKNGRMKGSEKLAPIDIATDVLMKRLKQKTLNEIFIEEPELIEAVNIISPFKSELTGLV